MIYKGLYVIKPKQPTNHSFVCTQLNGPAVLFQIIQYNISHLLTISLNAKQFYMTHR